MDHGRRPVHRVRIRVAVRRAIRARIEGWTARPAPASADGAVRERCSFGLADALDVSAPVWHARCGRGRARLPTTPPARDPRHQGSVDPLWTSRTSRTPASRAPCQRFAHREIPKMLVNNSATGPPMDCARLEHLSLRTPSPPLSAGRSAASLLLHCAAHLGSLARGLERRAPRQTRNSARGRPVRRHGRRAERPAFDSPRVRPRARGRKDLWPRFRAARSLGRNRFRPVRRDLQGSRYSRARTCSVTNRGLSGARSCSA
jgi:hypothetical protein